MRFESGPYGRSDVMSVEAAAEYLATTPRHVRRLYSERRLAYFKVGKRVRFRREDLDAFLAANRVESQ